MRQVRLRSILFFVVFALTSPALTACYASAVGAQASGSFDVEVHPRSELEAAGNPDSEKDLTTVTITANGPDGRPLRNAIVDLRLTAPTFGALVRSDIPRIEGRELLQTRFLVPDGEYTFQYVWPIRGDYQIDLRAEPAPGSGPGATFTPFADRLTLAVGERSGEAPRFLLALAVLFAFGALSALVLVRAQRARSGVPSAGGVGRVTSARLRGLQVSASGILGVALAALVLTLVAFVVVQQINDMRADNEAAGYQGAGAGETGRVATGPVVLEYHLSRSSADGIGVQTLLTTSGTIKEAGTGQPIAGAGVRLEAVDLEGGEVVFATQAVTPDGHFAWQHDFWDGIDYALNVVALPGESGLAFQPVSKTLEIAVAAMSPPLPTKLIGLGYTVAAFVAGIGGTLFLTQRRRRRGERRITGGSTLPRLDPGTP